MLIDPDCDVKTLDILDALQWKNIESRPIWKPMHMQPVFAENDFIYVEDKPVGEEIFEKGLCLPSDIKMTEDEQEYVIKCIRACFGA